MGWATTHIARLQRGETIYFRPHGNSMTPRIHSGDLCTVEPADVSTLCVGDAVLCHVSGSDYLHIIKAIQSGRFQIGNNHGHINGWCSGEKIYGKLISVQP